MVLNKTGGHVDPANPHTRQEIAAAAVTPYDAVIQLNGETHVAPMDSIDPDKVELACDDTGCVLIPDDGNPHNDLIPRESHAQHQAL